MAANVGADMRRPDLTLQKFDGAEYRPFRATGTESRWARRQVADGGRRDGPVRQHSARALRYSMGVETCWFCFSDKSRQTVDQHIGGVFSRFRQRPFAENARLNIGAAEFNVDCLLDVVGIALLHDQYCALAEAEVSDLLRHQWIDDV